mgnify:FL=1
MDAARYFEMMHRAMSARKRDTTLLLRVKVQDLGGADAYLELRQEPGSGRVRVFYSTMGRRNLNFQLFRKGWQLCHNASGEMTGRFPAKADELLSADDFAAYIRDDALDAGRAERVLHELRRCSGDHTAALPRNAREGALITVDSFVGRGAHWCYWSTDAAAQLPMAAVLCWLGDFLAGTERRTLQSCPEAVQLAAQWQADLASPFACPVDRMPQPMAPTAPAAARRASAQPVQNPRWQSILAVLATV